ncbi:hypothetical protein ACFQO4_20705 [Saliphagus sp. GCM10025334]
MVRNHIPNRVATGVKQFAAIHLSVVAIVSVVHVTILLYVFSDSSSVVDYLLFSAGAFAEFVANPYLLALSLAGVAGVSSYLYAEDLPERVRSAGLAVAYAPLVEFLSRTAVLTGLLGYGAFVGGVEWYEVAYSPVLSFFEFNPVLAVDVFSWPGTGLRPDTGNEFIDVIVAFGGVLVAYAIAVGIAYAVHRRAIQPRFEDR